MCVSLAWSSVKGEGDLQVFQGLKSYFLAKSDNSQMRRILLPSYWPRHWIQESRPLWKTSDIKEKYARKNVIKSLEAQIGDSEVIKPQTALHIPCGSQPNFWPSLPESECKQWHYSKKNRVLWVLDGPTPTLKRAYFINTAWSGLCVY